MKHLLAILLLLITSVLVQAQIRMGPKLGLNGVLPKLNNQEIVSMPAKADANIGVFFSKDLNSGDKLQIELNYYTKVDIEFESSGSQIATLRDIGFISLPIQYGFKFGKYNLYGLMGVSILYTKAWTNFDETDLSPVYDLIVPTGSTPPASTSDSATGIGGKVGIEYYFNKLSLMMYYEFPFITDYLYVVDDSELLFSHIGVSLYYSIIK